MPPTAKAAKALMKATPSASGKPSTKAAPKTTPKTTAKATGKVAIGAATSSARPAAKAGGKAVSAPAAKPAKLPGLSKMARSSKADKPKKPKLVRDSFTIPKAEFAVIDELKQRAAKAGAPAKKSELLRAGIKALAGLDTPAFLAALQAVPAIKTGRPAKS